VEAGDHVAPALQRRPDVGPPGLLERAADGRDADQEGVDLADVVHRGDDRRVPHVGDVVRHLRPGGVAVEHGGHVVVAVPHDAERRLGAVGELLVSENRDAHGVPLYTGGYILASLRTQASGRSAAPESVGSRTRLRAKTRTGSDRPG